MPENKRVISVRMGGWRRGRIRDQVPVQVSVEVPESQEKKGGKSESLVGM
jgi:hypothetical protein